MSGLKVDNNCAEALGLWIENRMYEIKADLQETLLTDEDYIKEDKRSEVLHKSLLLADLYRAFKVTLGFDAHKLLFDLIANQVTFK